MICLAGHEVPPPEVKVLHIWNRSRRNVVCNLVTSGEKESGIGETLTPTPTPMPHAALPFAVVVHVFAALHQLTRGMENGGEREEDGNGIKERNK